MKIDTFAGVSLLAFVSTISGIETSPICQTQPCIAVADEISSFMDLTADPCQDFFQFSCGGYVNSVNLGNRPSTQMNRRLERLITITKPRENDFRVDREVRNFYEACEKFQPSNNPLRTELETLKILAKQIKTSLMKVGLRDWPYTETTFGERDFAWYKTVPKMIEEGIVFTDGRVELPIINIYVGVSDLTKDEYVLKIDSPDFDEYDGKNWNDAWDDYELKDIPHYKKLHITRAKPLMEILNPYINNDLHLNRSIEIDSKLDDISTFTDRYDRVTLEYGKGNYTQVPLDEVAPIPCGVEFGCKEKVDWISYIDSLLVASGADKKKISPKQNVIIKDPYYLDHLNETLQGLAIQPFEMANYMGFKILVDYIVGADNLKNAFQEHCISYLTQGYDEDRHYFENGLLNVAVGSMYAREYFPIEKKNDAVKQVQYIRKAFEFLAPHITWMDEETKSNALEKLRAMGQFIAYPDEFLDRSTMDDYYKGVVVMIHLLY